MGAVGRSLQWTPFLRLQREFDSMWGVERFRERCGVDKSAAMKCSWRRRLAAVFALGSLAVLSGCGAPFANVFMGDSITAFWSVPGANLGYPGNTTAQMLARYPGEVPGHGYRTFILLGGTNDVRYFVTTEVAISHIATMAQTAREQGMYVALCTLPPMYINRFSLDPAVRQLNAAIKGLAAQQNYYLVDYYTPMIGHPEYFRDQLHPNSLGYAVMNRALVEVLKSIPAK